MPMFYLIKKEVKPMFNLRNKIYEKMSNHWKAFLCVAMVFCVINASYAFGAKVLLVVGKKDNAGQKDLRSGDLSIKNHLEKRGLNVIVREDTIVKSEDASGMNLVILSESARSREVGNKFRNVAVPVICSEPWIFSNLGMTGQTKKVDFGRKSRQTKLIIINPDHPLCASCSEEVQVCSNSFFMGWGVPGENAIAVAGLSQDPGKCTIFAYDVGVEMPGLVAPAKRIGLFLFRNTANSFTTEGWSLFDAAVDWSIPNSQATLKTELQPNSAQK